MFNHAYRSWLAGLAFVALTGCGGVSLSFAYFDDISEESVQELSFQDITPVIPSAIRDRRLVVIRDLSNWDALWREHAASVSPIPALPTINFAQNMVIGIFLGAPVGLCRDVQITSVLRYFNPDHIDVTFREITILSGINCTTPQNNPARIIALPYSSLPVNFIQVE